jgi:hypothetical protein
VSQGLAADGAKLAMYRLGREGYRVVNFIHDEFLIELPDDADHFAQACRIERILVEEMRTGGAQRKPQGWLTTPSTASY